MLYRCPVIAMHLPAKAGGAGEVVPTRGILGPAVLLRPSDYAEQPRALEPLTREDIERRDSTRDNPLLGIRTGLNGRRLPGLARGSSVAGSGT